MRSVAKLKAARNSLFSCRICSKTGAESSLVIAFAKPSLDEALTEALPREVRRTGGEKLLEGGGVFRRTSAQVLVAGRRVWVVEPKERLSMGFGGTWLERGVEFRTGIMPAERVRRKPCEPTSGEVRCEVVASVFAAAEIDVGALLLLAAILGGDGALVLESLGGVVIVRPGSTRCFSIGISDASLDVGLLFASAAYSAVVQTVGCDLLSFSGL